MKPILETERLILREFVPDDAQAVYEFDSNEEVNRYTGEECLDSVDSAREIITGILIPDYRKYGYGRWAVIYKPDGKLIGFSGLKYLSEIGETDLGFRFSPEYWGKGIATESARLVVDHGFEKLGLSSIIAIAMPENKGSCRVLEKAGFYLYKTGEYLGDGGNHNWFRLNRGGV